MDFSVVVASTDAARSIVSCLQRLEAACAGLRSEVLVCDASEDETLQQARDIVGPTQVFQFPAGTLTPVLWAEGLRRSSGRIVAFTTGHCLVSSGWATALIDALDGGATGAGGSLVIAPGTQPLDWAVYYLRYSAFMPESLGSGRINIIGGEIAGDNAAYRRDALDRHQQSFAKGFWEVDFHRSIRADGGWLAAVPDAVAQFGPSFPCRTIAIHRFAHGRQFGAGRVRGGTRRAWQIILAAPLVPLVLAVRAGRRVVGAAEGQWRFFAALPWFVVLAGAWAAGEAWGALKGNGE